MARTAPLARAYVVTQGSTDDDDQYTAPILHKTTCWPAALLRAEAESANVYGVFGQDAMLTPACEGCTPRCGLLMPRRSRAK